MSEQQRAPRELLKQTQQLDPLLQISPSAIVITDRHSSVIAWNPAAEELFGYSAQEAIGQNLDDLVAKTEELHRAAVAYSERALGKGEIRTMTRRTRKDGSLVDVEVRAAPLLADGEIIGTFGIYHDVTELHRQKRFYEALLDVSPAAIVAIDPQDRVTLWNPAAERMFGFTAEEAVGRDVDDLVARDEGIRDEAQRLNRTAKGGQVRTVSRRTRKDGSLVDVELLGAPVQVGGELVGRYAIYLDISELQRRKQYYEALLELSPTAIATVDPGDNITSWNPAAQRLFGYTAQEAIGKNIDQLVANREDLRDEAMHVSNQIAEREFRLTTQRIRKDGSLVDVHVTAAPIFVGGELVGKYALYHDISELQEQKRFYEALVEASPVAVVLVDLDGETVNSWNPAAEQLFGYTAEEAIGRSILDLVARREELRAEAHGYTQALKAAEPIHAVTRRTRKDGSLVDVEVLGVPVIIGGKHVGDYVLYHDISELQRQKQYYQSVLELSPTAIVTVDEGFHVTSWNPAAQQLFGYTPEEALGRFVDDLVANSPEQREQAAAFNQAGSQGEEVRGITRRTRQDGSLVDVEIVAAPVYVAGERVGHSVIYHDLTEIQRQKRYYEAILDVSPAAIVTVVPEAATTRVTSWNPAAEELFGYTAQEAIGQILDDLVARTDQMRQEASSITRRGLDGTRTRRITRRTRKDGTLVDVELLGAPVMVGGERVADIVVYHDITEIQRQKRYYESLLETSRSAIMTVDLDFTVTSWNPAAERLLGYSREEAIGRNIDDLVANRAEIRDQALVVSQQARAGEQVHQVTRRARKDGSLVDVDLVAAPIFVGGQLVAFYAMYTDISEIQRQKRYYEALFQSSPVAIALLEGGGQVASWNPAAEELFGYTAEEAIGRNIDDLVAAAEEIRAEAMGFTGRGETGELVHAITRRTRKDGSLVDVELVAVPVTIGGEQLGYYVMYHDLSEIQRQKRYWEALFLSNPVAIALLDLDGRVTAWNPTAEALFGYSAAEAIGRNIDDLVAASDEIRAEAERFTEEGVRGEREHHVITRRTQKDGTLVDVEMFGAAVMVAGEPVGLYGMYHDIRELQQARREAEAATRAKSAFLATMSHEIRTPLNAVIGMTGLLLDTALTPEQRGYGEVIRSSGDALLGVINDILDFSKIEAGRLDLESEPFPVRQCVESALELVAAAAADKSLDLAYVIDPGTPASVVGDLARLRQILLNLLNNAVKFTDQGEVVLKVDATPIASAGNGATRWYEVHFTVRDTGIGIPEERIDRLFDAFTQVDASTTRRYGGSGLGLAISKRLAEEMGGRMWVESRVGEGSTFHATIQAEAAAGPIAAEELEAVPELGGKHVLIVDDNATNREILRRQAESWGMVPTEVASPKEALHRVRRGDPFDLAILDMQMPEMDGQALAAEIRRHRDAQALPLVMLTSLGRREPSSPGAEFAAYLTKPIRPSQLFDALIGIFAPRMAPTKVARPEAAAVATPEERPHLRILLAEDNAVNQRVALLLLEKIGYRADVAADGREVLQALDRQPYDVVLMDVQMPEMDGLEATRRILERWPGPDRPRIIAMTAGATEADREACLAAGMDDYVSKPIRHEELAAALARSAPSEGGSNDRGREGAAAIDRGALDQLRRTVGGEEALDEVLTTFLEDTERILSALRSDVQADRPAEVRRHAHSLKSTAASFGASDLSDLCRRLEDLGRAGQLDEAAALVEGIAAEFGRVRETLRPGKRG